MKLAIISHTPHYLRDGVIVGWGPTVREIDYLGRLFERVNHIAPLHGASPPSSALPYQNGRVTFIPVHPAGGDSLSAKVAISKVVPKYIRALLQLIPQVDVVHVRCPANISLIAIVLLAMARKPRYRWVKYAGNWRPTGEEPWSYTFQRWWLNHGLHRGVVTINGRWPDQPSHVFSFYNPCLTQEDLERGKEAAGKKRLEPPYKLLFVGRVEEAKGIGRALELARMLKESGEDFHLHIVGDGPERAFFERLVADYQLQDRVYFHGWMPKPVLADFYARSHFFIFPSSSEGWPKVLSEATAYGVVPLASNVSSIPQILGRLGTGKAFPPGDVRSFYEALIEYIRDPGIWKLESMKGLNGAHLFSYSHYLGQVREMFRKAWGVEL